MLDIQIKSIDNQTLLDKIKSEQKQQELIKHKKILTKKLLQKYGLSFEYLTKIEAFSSPVKTIEQKQTYSINEFLAYYDVDFIRNVYLGLLKREPDESGYANYLHLLRSGKLHKIEILGRLYLSKEGKSKKVKIKGLMSKFLMRVLYKIPVLGYFLRWITTLLRLPKIVEYNEQIESLIMAHLYMANSDNENNIEDIKKSINHMIKQNNHNFKNLEYGLGEMIIGNSHD